jgi:hypothetical protein
MQEMKKHVEHMKDLYRAAAQAVSNLSLSTATGCSSRS